MDYFAINAVASRLENGQKNLTNDCGLIGGTPNEKLFSLVFPCAGHVTGTVSNPT